MRLHKFLDTTSIFVYKTLICDLYTIMVLLFCMFFCWQRNGQRHVLALGAWTLIQTGEWTKGRIRKSCIGSLHIQCHDGSLLLFSKIIPPDIKKAGSNCSNRLLMKIKDFYFAVCG
ncbi:hypothetical protein FHX64_001729 [Microbacter margulisiae]|uniref:Uncharacterized protein n=1 Tax=Microbacter margulisiae TaxID=1350067 RepID=A0A7W5H2L5_9PORP|nr:hypothetical protein [Microbacter margulisiae]